MAQTNIGTILREGRLAKNLSQAQVAKILKLKSPQSISDWERNYGSGIPLGTLKKLIRVYELDVIQVFDALLSFQQNKLKEKLEQQFFGKKSG